MYVCQLHDKLVTPNSEAVGDFPVCALSQVRVQSEILIYSAHEASALALIGYDRYCDLKEQQYGCLPDIINNLI